MHRASKLDRWVIAYAQRVIRWRWPILAGLTLLALVAASGAGRLAFATNYRVFFGQGNPELAAFEAVQNIYTKNDGILFVVTPDDGEVFTRRTLAAIEELTEKAWPRSRGPAAARSTGGTSPSSWPSRKSRRRRSSEPSS